MFKDFNKASLDKAAQVLHVDVPPGATKPQIRAALLDAGYTEDDYRSRLGIEESYTDLPDEEPEDVAAYPARVYVRFLGRNLSYSNKFGTFSRTKPVFQVNKDTADAMIQHTPDKFRLARRDEIPA